MTYFHFIGTQRDCTRLTIEILMTRIIHAYFAVGAECGPDYEYEAIMVVSFHGDSKVESFSNNWDSIMVGIHGKSSSRVSCYVVLPSGEDVLAIGPLFGPLRPPAQGAPQQDLRVLAKSRHQDIGMTRYETSRDKLQR